jgi:hypothetical protein
MQRLTTTPTNRAASPVDDEGRIAVAGADGWLYLPFKHDERTGEHEITLLRESDGEEVRFTMPASSSRATSSARSPCS